MDKFISELERSFELKLPLKKFFRHTPSMRNITTLVAVMFIVLPSLFLFGNSTGQDGIENGAATSLFASEDEYLRHVRDHVSFEELRLIIVKIERGDNHWKVARRYGVDIDTLIGANPYWKSLLARTEQLVIVPSQKGVLRFIRDLDELDGIAESYNAEPDDLLVQKMTLSERVLRVFSSNPSPIAVFVKDARPVAANMTASLARQFRLREKFRSPLGGRFSSFFGNRVHPIFHRWKFHDGLDIASRYGTPVGAPCEGRVTAAGWMGGYGKAVVIEHPGGYRTLCGHLSRIHVRAGQQVRAGQFIGRVGSTGYSTGPHLHFSLWKDGRYIDPMKVLW